MILVSPYISRSEAYVAIDVVAVTIVPKDISTGNTSGGVTVDRRAVLQVLQYLLKYVTALHFAGGSVGEHKVDFGAVVGVDQQHQLSLDDQESHLGVVDELLWEER